MDPRPYITNQNTHYGYILPQGFSFNLGLTSPVIGIAVSP